MARTRSIKPAFFANEHLAELSSGTRLLFIALWTIADKEGKLEDRPKRIKAELFPYDNFDINERLDELHNAGFIHRYQKNGVSVIFIYNFVKHQNPHPKEMSFGFPDAPEAAENCEAVKLSGSAETLSGSAAKINDESSLLPITYYPLPSTSNPIMDSLLPFTPAEKKNGNSKKSKKEDAPPAAHEPKKEKSYWYKGLVIRLVEKDYMKFMEMYSGNKTLYGANFDNFEAYLKKQDQWFYSRPMDTQSRWFHIFKNELTRIEKYRKGELENGDEVSGAVN